MSYQVIARKWRPKGFEELVGQSHITQTLLNALKHKRLHHALLFTGPRGTGKTSTARILARALRCPDDPLGESQEAQEISQGRNVNVIEIDGASNNGVDAIRELRDTIGYMPSSGKYKIYIIDEVHMLSTAAFNALLKTLEEPPEHVVFIMATTEVHKIPNTILSRCQRYDFRRIPLRLVTEHLNAICEAENVKAEKEALWVLARQGEGSMRDSQSLLDQVITFCGNEITLAKVVDVLGLTDRHLLLETLQGLLQRDSGQILTCLEKIFKSGYDPKLFVQDLLEEIRHALMTKVAPDQTQNLVDLPESEIDRLKEETKDLVEEELHLLFDMALKGANDLTRSQDPKIVLEMLLLRMSAAPRLVSLKGSALLSSAAASGPATSAPSMRATAPTPAPANTTPARASSASAAPSTSLASGKLEEKWLAFVEQVKKVNPRIGANLDHCHFIKLENKTVHLGVSEKMKFMRETVTQEDFLRKISNYLSTYWEPGHKVVMSAGATDGVTAKKLVEDKDKEKWEALRKQVEQHPLIRASQSLLKTEIKSIKETKS